MSQSKIIILIGFTAILVMVFIGSIIGIKKQLSYAEKI